MAALVDVWASENWRQQLNKSSGLMAKVAYIEGWLLDILTSPIICFIIRCTRKVSNKIKMYIYRKLTVTYCKLR